MNKSVAAHFQTRAGFATLTLCFAVAFASALPELGAAPTPSDALCTTDIECMQLCRADDPDCDGGPDSEEDGSDEWYAREQARLCRLDAEHCDEE